MVKGVKGEGDIGIGYSYSKIMISWAWPGGSTSIDIKPSLQILS